MPLYESECRQCGYRQEYYSPIITTESKPCQKCGQPTDRVFSAYVAKTFTPFTTRNLTGDGTPVTIRGPGQLRQMEAEHGVKLVDDPGVPAPQTRIPHIP